jgi:superfamily I DNA/RNA helicase
MSATADRHTSKPDLTAEQRAIVERDPADRILVTAAAGTGKTHCLVARLVHLIGQNELSPGSELLVLSFTRGVVREIRQRLAAVDGDAKFSRVITFDSFATWLLAQVDEGGEWIETGYDGRIEAATARLNDDPECRAVLACIRHLFVDEMQDLVGSRAELVKAVLLACPGAGFTLLGDPAQGIYNYQVEGQARLEGSQRLYSWVRQAFAPRLVELGLTTNHRAETPVARQALPFGPLLSGPSPDYRRLRSELDALVASLHQLNSLDDAAAFITKHPKPTAILCRNNGQAYILSRHLLRAGVRHRLQRGAAERAIAPWIALVLRDYAQATIGRSVFLARAECALKGEDPNPHDAWALLKRTEGGRGDTIALGQFAERIRLGNFPDELTEPVAADVIVSTIHRAKGLEFERVIVVPNNGSAAQADPAEFAEETRIIYVSLTRPRRDLMSLVPPNTYGISLSEKTDRWVRRYQAWQLCDYELRGSDVHSEDPAGGLLLKGVEPNATQIYIASNVRAGDSVTLVRKTLATAGHIRAHYAIMHNGNAVGITTESFSDQMYRDLKTSPRRIVNFPVSVEQVHVECVDTVAGTDAAGQRAGLGRSGVWLRVRVAGLGKLKYEPLPHRGR